VDANKGLDIVGAKVGARAVEDDWVAVSWLLTGTVVEEVFPATDALTKPLTVELTLCDIGEIAEHPAKIMVTMTRDVRINLLDFIS